MAVLMAPPEPDAYWISVGRLMDSRDAIATRKLSRSPGGRMRHVVNEASQSPFMRAMNEMNHPSHDGSSVLIQQEESNE